MIDNKKVDELRSLLTERSGLDISEAVIRYYNYLNAYESYVYDNEINYLADTLGVEIEPIF